MEGGCGIGGYVYCLYKKGYNVFGIDYAKETINRVKSLFHELNISIGNVKCLPFLSNYFGIYYSFGVIEHFFNGYEDIIKEAYRVIKPGGYFIVTFPAISLLNRIKIVMGWYKSNNTVDTNGLNFYQFAFNPTKVIYDLELLGFDLVSAKYKDGLFGLKNEIRLFKSVLQNLYSIRDRSLIIRVCIFALEEIFSPFSGHMYMIIMKKGKFSRHNMDKNIKE